MWGDVWGGGGAAAARTYTPLLGRATLLVPPCGRAGWPRAVAGGHNGRAGDPPPAAHGRCASAGATRTATAARPARLFLFFFFFFRGAVLVDHVAEATTLHPARCDGGRAGGRAWGGRYAHEGLG